MKIEISEFKNSEILKMQDLTLKCKRSNLYILCKYKINDPYGESVGSHFNNIYLNEFLFWGYDVVEIKFQILDNYVRKYYTFNQLKNSFDLMGAIYTFYNRVIDEDFMNEMIQNGISDKTLLKIKHKNKHNKNIYVRDIIKRCRSHEVIFSKLDKDNSTYIVKVR